jgi:hypothetical protein
MQSNPQKLWIPSPSAATITTDANFPGEVRIADQISVLAASVTRCGKVCASPCVNNVWTIEFQSVDFGNCNECGKSVGFILILDRNPDFDNQTYFEYNQRKQYVFQGNLSGTYTGSQLAQWFESYISDLYEQNDQHDQFLIEVTRVNETLTITLPCSGLVAYSLKGIFLLPNNNLPTAELPVITETQEAVEAVLSREKLLQQFPQEVGHVFGEAPRDQFMWCQNICVITLKGCIDPCSDFFDNQNSGHLHTAATPFDLMLYVNSAAPGFADFIDALNTEFSATCGANGGLSLAPGLQAGVQALYDAGGTVIDISSLEFDAVNGTPFVVSAGPVRIVVTATDEADLVAQINALFAGSTSYADPDITFIAGAGLFNEFAATTGYISIVPQVYQNYVGE